MRGEMMEVWLITPLMSSAGSISRLALYSGLAKLIAILAAVMTLRIAEINLLIGRELVVDLFVPTVAVEAAAGVVEQQIVGRPGPAGRPRLIGRLPDADGEELHGHRVEQALRNDIARNGVARPAAVHLAAWWPDCRSESRRRARPGNEKSPLSISVVGTVLSRLVDGVFVIDGVVGQPEGLVPAIVEFRE